MGVATVAGGKFEGEGKDRDLRDLFRWANAKLNVFVIVTFGWTPVCKLEGEGKDRDARDLFRWVVDGYLWMVGWRVVGWVGGPAAPTA